MTDERKTLSLRAIPVKQRIGEFYVTSILAKDLVAITFSDVRGLSSDADGIDEYLGIQREISQTRVNQIKRYLEGRDATFPTAVIVAVDERCAEFDEETGLLTLSSYQPKRRRGETEADDDDRAIPFDKMARVIDGQHRIAAFVDNSDSWEFVDNEINRKFELNVAIFVGADISEQASIFATVNLAQTKVNRSLVYDLTELATKRSPYRSCHDIAVMLDRESKSPLYKRIKRLGTATPGRKFEPLTQAGFVESLVKFISKDPDGDRRIMLTGKKLKRASHDELAKTPFRNMFIDGKELDIAEIIFNYFNAVKAKWPKSWDDLGRSSNLLPKSNAFKALMKFLKDDLYPKVAGDDFDEIPSQRDFGKFFADLEVTDSDFTTRNFAPGSGGQSTFLKMLRGEISIEDMERDDE